MLDSLAFVIASSLPVIAARTHGGRGVQDEVDTGGERTDVGLDVVTLGGDGGVKSEFRLLDGLAFVIASSLPVIAAGTHGGRGVQDEVDTEIKICGKVFAGALVGDKVVVDALDRSLLVHTVFIRVKRVVDRSTGTSDGLVVNAGLELLDIDAVVIR